MVDLQQRKLTEDDIDRMPADGKLRELVHGEVREWMSPAPEHGQLEARLTSKLVPFVEDRKLGVVMSGEVRFLLHGRTDHFREADIAFVRTDKYPSGNAPPRADTTVPDFVAEIISPSDMAAMVQEKVRDWLDMGVRLLWLIYPKTKEVVVVRADGSSLIVPRSGVLNGEDVFPGLSLPIGSFMP